MINEHTILQENSKARPPFLFYFNIIHNTYYSISFYLEKAEAREGPNRSCFCAKSFFLWNNQMKRPFNNGNDIEISPLSAVQTNRLINVFAVVSEIVPLEKTR